MRATEFLVDTRTMEVVAFPDWSAKAISAPETLHIPPQDVAGLSPDRDRPELLLRTLTAGWLLVRSLPGRRLVECHVADGWGRALRAATAAAARFDLSADTVLRLNNHLYDRAIVAPQDEWRRLQKSDYGQFIRRSVRTSIADSRCCARQARAVLVERQCEMIRQRDLKEMEERRQRLAEMCAAPRTDCMGILDRAAHRLVPAGTGSYYLPSGPHASVIPADLVILENRLASCRPWCLLVVDAASCPSTHANLFREWSGPRGLATTASPVLGEILDACRHHVAWTFLCLLAPTPSNPVREFGRLVHSRWEETRAHALLCDGERCMIKPAGGRAYAANCVRSIGDAESVLSRELYAPWSLEMIGALGFDQWVRHQSYPPYHVPLEWLR